MVQRYTFYLEHKRLFMENILSFSTYLLDNHTIEKHSKNCAIQKKVVTLQKL